MTGSVYEGHASAVDLNGSESHAHGSNHSGVHVASWNFNFVGVPLIVTSFILSTALFKIVLHRATRFSSIVPESCTLILLGVLFGALSTAGYAEDFKALLLFESRTFFLYLLPPIILESAYSLRDRAFIENIGTILLYAVVGTLFNILLIGGALYVLFVGGLIDYGDQNTNVRILHFFVFSALIAAVDPVAVLAIFQELGVNKMLYFMVFGESLLNDAVTIVVYNLMIAFLGVSEITAQDISLGFAQFFCVSLGGAAIGFLLGILTALVTKYTGSVRVVEPIVMFGMAYMSYLLAEMVHFSGIISIICCGIIQTQYAMDNISAKSYVTVHFFAKVMSSATECIIFIILGVMLVVGTHTWNTGFVLWTVFLVVVVRFGVVYALTFVVNAYEEGLRKIDSHEQFIMGYGGLRGAVSFSLVFMLDPKIFPLKELFNTTTCVVILFTAFVQGMTIKPLVNLLRIRKQTKDERIFPEVNRAIVENMTAAIEEISGQIGSNTCFYLRPCLQKRPRDRGSGLMKSYTEIELANNPGSIMQKDSLHNLDAVHRKSLFVRGLSMIDRSSLPGSTGEAMLRAQEDLDDNETSGRLNRRLKTRFEKPGDILRLRDALAQPFQKTNVYADTDRNLTRSRSMENLRRLLHLRRLMKSSDDCVRPGTGATAILGAALIPLTQGLTSSMANHVGGEGKEKEDKSSSQPSERVSLLLNDEEVPRRSRFSSGSADSSDYQSVTTESTALAVT